MGIYYFNPWVALGYAIFSILFFFLLMPFTICKYCYFKVKDTTKDKETGKTIEKLLSVNKWSKSHLHKHVGQKNWVWPMFIIWFLPIVLIIIALVRDFNYLPLIALIGFVVVLARYIFYMLKVKCPTCPIREECHSSF